jgi:hypothetical protein
MMPDRKKQKQSSSELFRRARYRVSSSRLRVPVLWLRHRGMRDSDVFLGSYPRSGSTWLRFTLFELLSGQSATFESVNKGMRGPGTHNQGLAALPNDGRFLSTHEAYRREYHRGVYLVRDVRDVVTSEFWYEKERGFGCKDFDEYLHLMLTGQKKYGSWQNHASSWLDSEIARSGNLKVIRYEDMRREPENVLADLLEFLGKPVNRSVIERAVANNALESMRAKEDALHKKPQQVRFPEKPAAPSSEDGRFVRQGLVGGWRQKLPLHAVQLVEQYAGETLARLGYEVESAVVEDCPQLSAS